MRVKSELQLLLPSDALGQLLHKGGRYVYVAVVLIINARHHRYPLHPSTLISQYTA